MTDHSQTIFALDYTDTLDSLSLYKGVDPAHSPTNNKPYTISRSIGYLRLQGIRRFTKAKKYVHRVTDIQETQITLYGYYSLIAVKLSDILTAKGFSQEEIQEIIDNINRISEDKTIRSYEYLRDFGRQYRDVDRTTLPDYITGEVRF